MSNVQDLSEYEKIRLKNIQERQMLLKELGLDKLKTELKEENRKPVKRAKKKPSSRTFEPSRRSERLQTSRSETVVTQNLGMFQKSKNFKSEFCQAQPSSGSSVAQLG